MSTNRNPDVPPAQRCRLPGVGRIWCRRGSRMEVKFIHREHFVEREYLRHGVVLQRGDTVFDVGANIGLFALFAFAECRGECRLFCFEPIAPIFWFLQKNAEEHGLSAAGVTLLNLGLTHLGGPEHTPFTYFPRLSGNSTQRPSEKNRQTQALLRVFDEPRHALELIGRAPPRRRPFYRAAYLAAYPILPLLRRRFLGMSETLETTGRLTTLSAVLNEHDVARIDLLKVDVEGAELDVLRGIEAADWPRIKQVAMEAHAIDGRAEQVVELLQRQGFQVKTEQPGWARAFELDNLTIYATRG